MMLPAADEIFLALAGIDPAERAAFLDARCGGDLELRRVVDDLVAALEAPDDFLDPSRIPSLDMAAVDGPLQPGTTLGQFLVLRALGSGGMGVVYAAQQDRPRRTVAIKVLRRGLTRPDMLRRFEHEAEMLGRLQHPGIAQVFAFCPGDRAVPAHLVMELVAGPPLTDYVRAEGLSIDERVGLVIKLAEAVQHAHARGVIHRDLKPANVLVAEGRQPKILDFGIARALGGDVQRITVQTGHGQLIGTLPYMSPEQLRGRASDVDARSDVYAIGVLLYRLLTDRLPFAFSHVPWTEAIQRVLESEPPPARAVNPLVAPALERIVARAMARDVRRRHQTAAGLADDLAGFLSGRPPAGGAAGIDEDVLEASDAVPPLVAVGAHTICVVTGAGRLLARHVDGGVELWSAYVGAACALAFSLSNQFVAVGLATGFLEWFDAKSGDRIAAVNAHRGPVISVAFSGDDKYLASAARDGVRLWDTSTGSLLATLDEPRHCGVHLAALPNGRIAVARRDGAVDPLALPSVTP